jgi:cysteinyl-tRNA synthetase
LARAVTEDGEARIEEVDGKRNAADFAIWRKTPAGETRQMEWDSPWGKGAPGWHLECSVMSKALLGLPFDIHTGGIDHREIHHPNEIAQNQAHEGCADSGARIWMHNNFLIERSGKMSKSSGEFLRLQLLIDKGFHPLAYRLMCLQAHYRSELEFSWEGLQAAQTRLSRLLRTVNKYALHYDNDHQGLSLAHAEANWEGVVRFRQLITQKLGAVAEKSLDALIAAVSDDLNTPSALTIVDELLLNGHLDHQQKSSFLALADEILGLNLNSTDYASLRIRPKAAIITETEIETALAARTEARAAKDFAKSDAIRDDLIAKGVEVMDGDPLGWDWKLDV